jgi:hypothetical protein
MQKRPYITLPGFYPSPNLMGMSPDDEQAAREGMAIERGPRSAAVRGTSRRRAKLTGGPKNRAKRKDLVLVAD